MPVLPSGRRVEFSLDRFHALLSRMDAEQAKAVAETLHNPDDLLFVLDAVHFGREDGTPFFADYVAADWRPYAAEWTGTDREAFRAWIESDEARVARAEAIRYIKALVLDRRNSPICYPYVVPGRQPHAPAYEGTTMRQ